MLSKQQRPALEGVAALEARVLHPYPLRAQYVGHRDLRIHDALQIKEIRHVVYGTNRPNLYTRT